MTTLETWHPVTPRWPMIRMLWKYQCMYPDSASFSVLVTVVYKVMCSFKSVRTEACKLCTWPPGRSPTQSKVQREEYTVDRHIPFLFPHCSSIYAVPGCCSGPCFSKDISKCLFLMLLLLWLGRSDVQGRISEETEANAHETIPHIIDWKTESITD